MSQVRAEIPTCASHGSNESNFSCVFVCGDSLIPVHELPLHCFTNDAGFTYTALMSNFL